MADTNGYDNSDKISDPNSNSTEQDFDRSKIQGQTLELHRYKTTDQKTQLKIVIHAKPRGGIKVALRIKRAHKFHSGEVFTTNVEKYSSCFQQKCRPAKDLSQEHLQKLFGQQGGNFIRQPLSQRQKDRLDKLTMESRKQLLRSYEPLHYLPRKIFGDSLPEEIYALANQCLLIPESYLICHDAGQVGLTDADTGNLSDSDDDDNISIADSSSSSTSASHVKVKSNEKGSDEKKSEGKVEIVAAEPKIGDIIRSRDSCEVVKVLGTYAKKSVNIADANVSADADDSGVGDDGEVIGEAGQFANLWKSKIGKRCMTELGPTNSLLRILVVTSVKMIPTKFLEAADTIFMFHRDKEEVKQLHRRAKLRNIIESSTILHAMMNQLDKNGGLVIHKSKAIYTDPRSGLRSLRESVGLSWTTDIIRKPESASSANANSSSSSSYTSSTSSNYDVNTAAAITGSHPYYAPAQQYESFDSSFLSLAPLSLSSNQSFPNSLPHSHPSHLSGGFNQLNQLSSQLPAHFPQSAYYFPTASPSGSGGYSPQTFYDHQQQQQQYQLPQHQLGNGGDWRDYQLGPFQ